MTERTYTPAQIAKRADTTLLRTAKTLADLSQMSDEDFHAVDIQLSGNAVETVRDWALQYLARRDAPRHIDRWESHQNLWHHLVFDHSDQIPGTWNGTTKPVDDLNQLHRALHPELIKQLAVVEEVEQDQEVRALISRQWKLDWDSEEDAVYDA